MEYILRTKYSAPVEAAVQEPDADLHVPALCDVEVAAVLRRGLLAGALAESRAQEALEDYLDLPLTMHGHQALMVRVLSLRQNLSAYDAVYVALAERMGAELLTVDHSLVRAVRTHTGVSTLPR